MLSEEFLTAFAKAYASVPWPDTFSVDDLDTAAEVINLSDIKIDAVTPFGAFATVTIDTESPGLIPGADEDAMQTSIAAQIEAGGRGPFID